MEPIINGGETMVDGLKALLIGKRAMITLGGEVLQQVPHEHGQLFPDRIKHL